MIDITPLFSFLGKIVGKFFTDIGLRFAAYKAMLITFVTVTIPIVIKNIFHWLFETIYSVIENSVDFSGMSEVALQLTGMAAYMAQEMLLVECVGILLAALAVRLVLNFIPFVG